MLAVAIIVSVVYRYARKDPLTGLQIILLIMVFLGNLMCCIDEKIEADNVEFNCDFYNYLMIGFEYFFFFNINFVVSWKFYRAASELKEFALHK